MNNRGFTIFIAVLVSSLALAVGLAIYDLLLREISLSQTASQSQFAIFAADTGAECALYWDSQCSLTGCASRSVFATSTSNKTGGNGTAFPPVSGVVCNSQDVAATAVAAGTWPVTVAPDGPPKVGEATTTFTVLINAANASGPCAIVTVAKWNGTPSRTDITSRGYNICVNNGSTRLERALHVSY
jgi:hypothetical protein